MSTKNFFIMFLFFLSTNVFAKNLQIVEKIHFQGLKHFSSNEILNNISVHIGKEINKIDIKHSIQSLFDTGKFEDIKVYYSNNTVIFKLKERPIISEIIILGKNLIKKDIFYKYLVQLGVKKGSSFNAFLNSIFLKNTKEFYYNLGYTHCSIKLFTTLFPNNTIRLKILFNEGEIPVIKNIKVIGNKDFSQKKIISFFQVNNYYSWLNVLNKKKYNYNILQLKKDLNKLSDFYLNHGYYFFNIKKKFINFSKNKINVILNVFEGDRYNISNVFIKSNSFQYNQNIKSIIKFHINEVYNKEKIDLIVQEIQKFLLERGYIQAYVNVQPKINFEKKTIILNFNINIRDRYFVNKIYFRGNKVTQDIVLRREIKQMEGSWFNLKLIELGKKSLEKINYLSDIQIKIKNVHNKTNAIDVMYIVKEKPTGSLNFGIGHGKDSGLSFNASVLQDNLWGTGNSLKASIVKNKNQKYADISLDYPFFINDGTNLNIRFFFNDSKYQLNKSSDLIKNSFGFENHLGFLFNESNRINIGFGYTHNSLFNKNEKKLKKEEIIDPKKSNNIVEDRFLDTSLKDDIVNDFTINYSWMHNTLKYISFPISGNQTYISGKNTIPGSDNNFYKFLFDSEQYIPLNKEESFIFLMHFRAGFGNSFNKGKLPFYENFYASDSNNIRGFLRNTIGPKKIDTNVNVKKCTGYYHDNMCESIESTGGNVMMMSNIEFITPIPFITKENSKFLRYSFFLDAGNIWDTQLKNKKDIHFFQWPIINNFHNIYASIGASLQWFSPIGPLIFSYAHPILTNNNNQLERFQFNIGKNW